MARKLSLLLLPLAAGLLAGRAPGVRSDRAGLPVGQQTTATERGETPRVPGPALLRAVAVEPRVPVKRHGPWAGQAHPSAGVSLAVPSWYGPATPLLPATPAPRPAPKKPYFPTGPPRSV